MSANKTQFFATYASNPQKRNRHSRYTMCRAGYRLSVDENTILRSYDLPIGATSILSNKTRAYYVHYRNSSVTTNRHIDELLHAIRQQMNPDTDKLFHVETVPMHPSRGDQPTATHLDDERHRMNLMTYENELLGYLKKISAPRLRLRTRIDAWRNAQHEWQAMVDYARFHNHDKLFDKWARWPKPLITEHFTPSQLAIAALEGYVL